MKNFSKNLFPLRLKELRGSLSQKEMADLIGIPQQTYAGWEVGNRQPKLEKLMSIALQFEVRSDWLLGLTDIRTPGASPVVTATGGSAASGTGNATVHAAPLPPTAPPASTDRLLTIIESQQRVIENLSRRK